ncbi:hypothetical protein [Dethiothermospora halolimnae]|uniref:hypothetical protein n=1 Tax=Dethiothermospora halolimnae TaxID=3114390 RepID=UPI003CCC1987
MDNEKIFNLMEKMYSEFTEFKSEVKDLKTEVKGLKTEVSDIKKTVIKIENDHGQKLDALFDGYKQNSEKLNEIEEEVKKHEEVIIRRVK